MEFKLNREHRRVYAEKLLDIANLAVGGLIFGQFISGHEFYITIALIGLVLFILIYIVVYFLLKRRK